MIMNPEIGYIEGEQTKTFSANNFEMKVKQILRVFTVYFSYEVNEILTKFVKKIIALFLLLCAVNYMK